MLHSEADEIHMPPREMFTGSATSAATEAYHYTLLHELTHWTALPHRCDRDLSDRFSTDAYAMRNWWPSRALRSCAPSLALRSSRGPTTRNICRTGSPFSKPTGARFHGRLQGWPGSGVFLQEDHNRKAICGRPEIFGNLLVRRKGADEGAHSCGHQSSRSSSRPRW